MIQTGSGPLPGNTNSRGKKKYPWHILVKPGDYIFVSGVKITSITPTVNALKYNPRHMYKRFKCTTERDPDGNPIGTKITLISWEDPRPGFGFNSEREKRAVLTGEDNWYQPE